jgi:hypothetical protein
MDWGTLILGLSGGIGILGYIIYIVQSANEDIAEHARDGRLFIEPPLLLPEQAASAHQPNIVVRFAEAWKEVKAEKEIKELPPLEKVRYTAPEVEEEEEWLLIPKEEEPEEEDAVSQGPTPAPTQSVASDIPIDLLESHSKRDYYNLLCDITDKVALSYKRNGKITRDGMVPSAITRKEWDHTMSQPNGIFWKAGMLETQNGVTVILEDCDSWLHLFLRERGYKFDDGIYSEDE